MEGERGGLFNRFVDRGLKDCVACRARVSVLCTNELTSSSVMRCCCDVVVVVFRGDWEGYISSLELSMVALVCKRRGDATDA